MVIYPCTNCFNEPKKEAATNSTKPPEIRERTWKNQQIEGNPEQNRTVSRREEASSVSHNSISPMSPRSLPNSDLRWLVVFRHPLKNDGVRQWEGWHPIDEMESHKSHVPVTTNQYDQYDSKWWKKRTSSWCPSCPETLEHSLSSLCSGYENQSSWGRGYLLDPCTLDGCNSQLWFGSGVQVMVLILSLTKKSTSWNLHDTMILLPISTMETYPAWLLRHLNHQAEGPSAGAEVPQQGVLSERASSSAEGGRPVAPRGAAWRLGMKNAGRCWEMRKIMGILLMILLLISGYSTRKKVDFRIFY